MYLLGTFINEQFPEDDREDIDLFNFPEIDSGHRRRRARRADRRLLHGGQAEERGRRQGVPEVPRLAGLPGRGRRGDQAALHRGQLQRRHQRVHPLQKKSAELVSQQKNIAQFLDRDTRPDFASTVVIPAFQEFIKNPDDIDGLTKSIEEQKKSIFAG